MTIRALCGRLLVNDHRFGIDQARLGMAFVARHSCMAALQWEVCSRVMVECGGNPALRIVAVRTSGLPGLCELAVMGVFVAIFAALRRALELHFLLADWRFVTITTLDGAVRSKQREFGFRMVETTHVCP